MKKNSLFYLLLPFFALFLNVSEVLARDAQGRYVIAYFENGKYSDFDRQKLLILNQMDKLGLKDKYVLPDELRFSPGWNIPEEDLEAVAEKVMALKDVDMIFSMGTSATKALLAKNNYKTPIIGVAISDPYRSAIVSSQTTSNTNNLAVLYVPNGWLQVFNTLHEIVGFNKMGIIYEDTVNGRSYANLDDSIEAGRNFGFSVLEYPFYNPRNPFESCRDGVKNLAARGVDALFISDIECFDKNIVDAESIIKLANSYKIATISNLGDLHVSEGTLISVSSYSSASLGDFFATRIKKILEDGAKPSDFPINADFNPEIIINFQTAQEIGADFSMPVMLSADKIYDSIKEEETNEEE
ncbi:MAG: ABC transporter substrate binding protein [Alphaproteobacteria bacterium]